MKFCKAELADLGARMPLAIAALMVMTASANAQQLPHSLRDALLGHKGPAEARRVAAPPVWALCLRKRRRLHLRPGRAPAADEVRQQRRGLGAVGPAGLARRCHLPQRPGRARAAGDQAGRHDPVSLDDAPMGAAAALSGRASSIQPPAIMSFSVFVQRVRIATARASRAAQRDIEFSTVEDVRPETSVLGRRLRHRRGRGFRTDGSRRATARSSPRSSVSCWPRAASRPRR